MHAIDECRQDPGAEEAVVARWRAGTYVTVATIMGLGYALLRGTSWQGSASAHTTMEVSATLLALTVGAMALVRFYSRKDSTFLFVGAGFLGTAFLDFYHAVVTSMVFKPFMPSDLPALIPWSWIASRQFLAVFLFLSWFAWWRKKRLATECRVNEKNIFALTGILALLSFLFFAFAPLPRAYYDELFFHRPEEFLPAVFFLGALIGYLRKGDWRHDEFEHWLVLSLVVAVIGQTVFMSFSGQLFDLAFDIAHLLKKASYICVLIGLLASMYAVFRREAASRIVIQEARAKAEASLAELASHKQALDQHAIVAVTDTAGTIILANSRFCEISGYSEDELIGANHRMLSSGHHPKTFFSDMYKIIARGEAWYGEIKNLSKGGAYYWVDTTISPIKDAAGKVVQYVAIRTDITKLKRIEEDLLSHGDQLEEMISKATEALWLKTEELEGALAKEKQLGELQRQFVSMASHEFRTPLAIIDSTAQRIQRRAGKNNLSPQDAIERVEKIRCAVQRMTRLMESTLSLARAEEGNIIVDIGPCHLGRIIAETCIHQQDLTGSCDICCDLGTLPDTIQADTGAVEQIFTNLINNAVKYSKGSSKIEVNGSCGGGNVMVTVRDYGIGIDQDDVARIGERFFRAKTSVGIEGTGIGLSLVRHLVESHGGRLEITTRKGEGSTFTVHLPVAGPDIQRPDDPARAKLADAV